MTDFKIGEIGVDDWGQLVQIVGTATYIVKDAAGTSRPISATKLLKVLDPNKAIAEYTADRRTIMQKEIDKLIAQRDALN